MPRTPRTDETHETRSSSSRASTGPERRTIPSCARTSIERGCETTRPIRDRTRSERTSSGTSPPRTRARVCAATPKARLRRSLEVVPIASPVASRGADGLVSQQSSPAPAAPRIEQVHQTGAGQQAPGPDPPFRHEESLISRQTRPRSKSRQYRCQGDDLASIDIYSQTTSSMGLSPGTRLGQYEILAPLGAGGMGEVYRARDTRLGRDVAIKILSGGLTSDPARLPRFEREARLLASLNHPGIAAVYGLEEAEGMPFIVMELVPGDTLSERLSAGALSIAESLEVARQIAEALESAHEHGVVHRRPQAREREGHAAGPGQGARPGTRQGVRHQVVGRNVEVSDHGAGADASGRDPRNRRVHEPRAGARQDGGQAGGHLGVRVRPVRDALGPAGVYRRDDLGCPRVDPHGRAGLGCAAARHASARSGAPRAVPRERPESPPARHRRSTHHDGRRSRGPQADFLGLGPPGGGPFPAPLAAARSCGGGGRDPDGSLDLERAPRGRRSARLDRSPKAVTSPCSSPT